MSWYTPDAYRVLLIEHNGEKLIKIFGAWHGGYASGDAWRLNSGCKSITETSEVYRFHGYSGSVYETAKTEGFLTSYCSGILNRILETDGIALISVEEAIQILEEMKDET